MLNERPPLKKAVGFVCKEAGLDVDATVRVAPPSLACVGLQVRRARAVWSVGRPAHVLRVILRAAARLAAALCVDVLIIVFVIILSYLILSYSSLLCRVLDMCRYDTDMYEPL